MTRNGQDKAIYVLFSDEEKSAEFKIPECKLLRNKGFSDEEISQLLQYVNNEQDSIFKIAKEINPMKAFMKDE